MNQERDFWSGRQGFVLATIGAAVGLGSIWKFPYEVGANGGGAFILFYLLGLALVVFPLCLVELAIGRRGRADAAQAIVAVARSAGASRHWGMIGALGVATAFTILSFYSVIAGWAIGYAIETPFRGVADRADIAQARFDAFLAAPLMMTACHALFMGTVAIIVMRGISHGIEMACKFLMPALIALLVLLSAYSLVKGDAGAALRFLFRPDPDHFTWQAALDALGLGFFSIGVGLSLMITYAAHARPDINLRDAALITVLGDTAISIVAGIAIFPIVFAEGLDPTSGPGLLFVTLPLAFAQIPGGGFATFGFFLLLIVAAVASGISMLEMPVAALVRRGWTRRNATIVCAVACWTCGLATVFSFNLWADWHPLAAVHGFSTATVFDLLDHLTSNIMLPLGGFALALFAGWRLSAKLLGDELGLSVPAARMLLFLLRYLIPTCIAGVTLIPLLG